MYSGRWKKLAIAGAILTVGVGAALLFRREEGDSQASITQKPPSDVVAKAASRPEVIKTDKAKLAGHIEPYAPLSERVSDDAYNVRDTELKSGVDSNVLPATPPTENAEPSDPPLAKSTAEVDGDIITAPPSARSPLKWQTVQRPAMSAAREENLGGLTRGPVVSSEIRSETIARRHRIVDGDSLRDLARRYMGDENRHLDLFEFNRDVLASPELLPIGAELRIPPNGFARPTATVPEPMPSRSAIVAQALPPAVSANAPPRDLPHGSPPAVPQMPTQVYVVQPRDTLPFIARKLYGDISRQADLLAANRPQLRSAKDLRPGMRLVVPAPRKP